MCLLFTGGLFDGSYDTENAFKYAVAAVNNRKDHKGATLKAGTVDLKEFPKLPSVHLILNYF